MSISFDVPAELAARYAAGLLVRDGALLRNSDTGRIVAHLQETTALAGRFAAATNPAGMAMEAGKLGLGAVQVAQNEQIKAGIALMQQLQVANLALTGIGIGVSVVGFGLVLQQLQGIRRQLEGFGAALAGIRQAVDEVQATLDRRKLSELTAALRRIDGAWGRGDAQLEWAAAAADLLRLEQEFLDDIRALPEGTATMARRIGLVEAFVMAGNARTGALLAAGHEAAAEEAAAEFAGRLEEVTGALGAPRILRAMLEAEQTPVDPQARLTAVERLRPEAERQALLLREREAAATTLPLTIAALQQAGIPGRQWLQDARERTDVPLLCLLVE